MAGPYKIYVSGKPYYYYNSYRTYQAARGTAGKLRKRYNTRSYIKVIGGYYTEFCLYVNKRLK